ncbi:hypothetical protein GLOIN_2v1474266 [Rhizophagus clarus]|uniref:Hsp70 family protein n=1 Tax=Rhizophagus clarus TaxID=94130 RepID=A0A8H3M3E6_9GLOM|nr:hypothetical protein GLOIN_2v1474266 [Rhizophagus clarus]
MTNERCSSENLSSDKSREVIEKLGIGFHKLNNKFVNILEENQKINRQYKNLEEKIQQILHTNSELSEKYQEILRTNSELNEKNQEILRINSNLIEENNEASRINSELRKQIQERDKQFEDLQKHVSNLEKQRNDELQQLQQLEIVTQTLEKNLEIMKCDEIDENIIKVLKENNDDFSSNFLKSLEKDTEESMPSFNIKVVVGLDFGVTYSGFAYCHVQTIQNVCSNVNWHGEVGQIKTNTALLYDNGYNNLLRWGAPALAEKLKHRKIKLEESRPIELFKLYLSDSSDKLKPKLPIGCKKAITDYFKEIGKVIKETITTRWPTIYYFEDVLLVVTIPSEFSGKSKAIMRSCAYNAELIKEERSTNLQFITEPKAAAMYCVTNLENRVQPMVIPQSNSSVMIIDCGGSIVNLTTLKLMDNIKKFGEITKEAKDFCGSTFVDAEFIQYLRSVLGDEPIDLLKDKHYKQMQYLIQHFCEYGKIPFTGDDPDFLYELDIQYTIPILKQYINDDEIRETLEESDWIIEIDFKTMKSIFDPVIEKILHLIKSQLDNTNETCSAMFLVGGFCESKYLQERVKKEFGHRVIVPAQPIAAISRGAVIYELSKRVICTRIAKYTYGIGSYVDWNKGIDPFIRRTPDGKIYKFMTLVKRGTVIKCGETFSFNFKLESNQSSASFTIYYTSNHNPVFCDEPEMKQLGIYDLDLPDVHSDNRIVKFGLTFNQYEVTAFAMNELNGRTYKTQYRN